jgi:hypothetical protein
MDIDTLSAVPQFEHQPNCWTRSRIDVQMEELGDICTVRKVALAVYSVTSSCATPPASFWSVIESWGNTWLWENLTIWGEISWLGESIADNSLVAVTDGSYMKDIDPQINLAAFIFKCTKGQGQLWGSLWRTPRMQGAIGGGGGQGHMANHFIIRAVN